MAEVRPHNNSRRSSPKAGQRSYANTFFEAIQVLMNLFGCHTFVDGLSENTPAECSPNYTSIKLGHFYRECAQVERGVGAWGVERGDFYLFGY